MESSELKDISELVTQAIKNDLSSFSTDFPPSFMRKMDKLLAHVTLCNHTYEYSCHHIPRWFCWLKPDSSDDDIKLAGILGWIFQFMSSFLLSFDDVADKSELRFGRPTWYSQHKDSANLLFDIQLIQSWTYFLLSKFLSKHPLYNQLLDFMSSTWYSVVKSCRLEIELEWKNLQTEDGLYEDAINWKNYNLIAQEKATVVHMFLPVAWSLTLAGYDINKYKDAYDSAKGISDLLGIVIQSMDDYYDCFSESENCDDKNGDIRNGQFSWLLVQAKDLCTFEQWQQIKLHYGRDNIDSINSVKQIYKDIGIKKIWKKNKEDKLAEIYSKANECFKPEHEVFKRIVLSYVDFCMQVFTG